MVLAVAVLLLAGCSTPVATATECEPGSTAPAVHGASSLIAQATWAADVQIVGSIPAPQVIVTTPQAQFDGGPVTVTFSAQYANMVPDPASQLNGLGFELYIDGVIVERIALFGSHSQVSLFGPVAVSDTLTGARAPTAGVHTVSVGAWKWSPGGDGYLKAGAGAMPITLTITRA